MSRDEAITELVSVYGIFINDRCVGASEEDETWAALREALTALGATEDELSSVG